MCYTILFILYINNINKFRNAVAFFGVPTELNCLAHNGADSVPTNRHWRLQLFIARNQMARVNPESLASSHCSAAVAPVRYFVFHLHHGTMGRYMALEAV